MTKHCAGGTTGDSGKEWLKILVFECFLKTDIDDADVTFSGKVFHSREAATRKSSIADGWTTGASDDRRWWRSRSETLTSLVSRPYVYFPCFGASPLSVLVTTLNILLAERNTNGSVTITTKIRVDRATTLSRMNLSVHVWHVTIFSWICSLLRAV